MTFNLETSSKTFKERQAFSMVEILVVIFLSSLMIAFSWDYLKSSVDYAERQKLKSQILSFLEECAELSLRNSSTCITDYNGEELTNQQHGAIIRREKIKKGNFDLTFKGPIRWGLHYGQFRSGSFTISYDDKEINIVVSTKGRIVIR